MIVAVADKAYTPEDLLSLNGEHSYELIDGKLVEKPVSAVSGRISARLIGRLDPFAEAHQLGSTFTDECSYQIFPNAPTRVRKPDGSFISKARLSGRRLPKGHLRIAPNLAWEVVSPNELAPDVEQKIVDYVLAGITLIWIIYPNTQTVYVIRANKQVSRLTIEDELRGEDVVPDFVCPLADLFQGLDPETDEPHGAN